MTNKTLLKANQLNKEILVLEEVLMQINTSTSLHLYSYNYGVLYSIELSDIQSIIDDITNSLNELKLKFKNLK